MSASTSDEPRATPAWLPSVYYAETLVNCALDVAWKLMLDYQAWNPDFATAQIERLRGEASAEGELNLIKMVGDNGEVLAEFYSETVKVVSRRHIVWYVYPKEGSAFRNFVDFWLENAESRVRFSIYYYAQNPVTLDTLAQQRQEMEAGLQNLAAAFKAYCEK